MRNTLLLVSRVSALKFMKGMCLLLYHLFVSRTNTYISKCGWYSKEVTTCSSSLFFVKHSFKLRLPIKWGVYCKSWKIQCVNFSDDLLVSKIKNTKNWTTMLNRSYSRLLWLNTIQSNATHSIRMISIICCIAGLPPQQLDSICHGNLERMITFTSPL